LAIVGAIVVKINPKIGGTLMLISGIGGLISISMFYVLATVFLVIAGLMESSARINKKKCQHESKGGIFLFWRITKTALSIFRRGL
jgi:uncharacterized membrane protein SirB2